MGDEQGDLTHGEIRRTLERLEEDVALAATKEALAEFKGEVREKFKRAESLALERRDALAKQIGDVGTQVTGVKTAIETGKTRSTAKAANWIALGLLTLTALGLVVTIVTVAHGGR